MKRNFTSASERIVRILHPVLYQELVDIASDLDMPLQHVFNVFCDVIFNEYDMDKVLLKVVVDCEEVKKKDFSDIPY